MNTFFFLYRDIIITNSQKIIFDTMYLIFSFFKSARPVRYLISSLSILQYSSQNQNKQYAGDQKQYCYQCDSDAFSFIESLGRGR